MGAGPGRQGSFQPIHTARNPTSPFPRKQSFPTDRPGAVQGTAVRTQARFAPADNLKRRCYANLPVLAWFHLDNVDNVQMCPNQGGGS